MHCCQIIHGSPAIPRLPQPPSHTRVGLRCEILTRRPPSLPVRSRSLSTPPPVRPSLPSALLNLLCARGARAAEPQLALTARDHLVLRLLPLLLVLPALRLRVPPQAGQSLSSAVSFSFGQHRPFSHSLIRSAPLIGQYRSFGYSAIRSFARVCVWLGRGVVHCSSVGSGVRGLRRVALMSFCRVGVVGLSHSFGSFKHVFGLRHTPRAQHLHVVEMLRAGAGRCGAGGVALAARGENRSQSGSV